MLCDRIGISDNGRCRIFCRLCDNDHIAVIEEQLCVSFVHVEQGARFYVLPCPTERLHCANSHGYELLALVATTNDFG